MTQTCPTCSVFHTWYASQLIQIQQRISVIAWRLIELLLLLLLLLLLGRSIQIDLGFISRHVNLFLRHSPTATGAGKNHTSAMGIRIISSAQQLLV